MNFEEATLLSTAKGLTLPSVKIHELIYVPKTEEDFKTLHRNSMNDDANFSNNDSESNRRITHDFSRDEDTKFHTLAYKFDPEKEVQIRILSD